MENILTKIESLCLWSLGLILDPTELSVEINSSKAPENKAAIKCAGK